MIRNTAAPIWAGFAMVAGFMGTALISPLYPLYQSAWNLQVGEVTFLYVIYMLGALGSFLFFGSLADKVGFRRLMLVALALSLGGTLISIFAANVFWLSVGRFVVGAASSIVMPAGAVALTALLPAESKPHQGLIMALLLSFGFGIGPLIGGIVGQWAPDPLTTAYLPVVFVLVAAFAGMALKVPSPAGENAACRLTIKDVLPKLTAPDPGLGLPFGIACAFPFLAFGTFGIYASLSPLFIAGSLGWSGPIASGASIAFILFGSALFQVVIRRAPTGRIAMWGLLALALSSVALMANLSAGSAVLFALSLILTAVGHSMTMLAGMTLLNTLATAGNRAGLTSSYLVVAYTGAIVPLLGVGWISDHWGLSLGVTSFCVLNLALCTLLAVAFHCTAQKKVGNFSQAL